MNILNRIKEEEKLFQRKILNSRIIEEKIK